MVVVVDVVEVVIVVVVVVLVVVVVVPSLQSGVPFPSESTSDTPQPHIPGSVLSGSSGQLSQASPTPSASESD